MLGLNASMAPAPRYHFSGIAGAGMNPLARLMRERGHEVQGSDRSIDAGKNRDLADRLRGMGIELYPHDGKAVTEAIDRFVYSTAVEPDTPEMRAATRLSLELVLPAGAAGRDRQRRGARGGHRRDQRQEHRSPGWWRGCCARAGHGDGPGRRGAGGRGQQRLLHPRPGRWARGRRGLRVGRHAGRLLPDRSAWSTTSAAITPSSPRCVRSSPRSGPTASGCWSTPAAPEAAALGRRFKAFSYGLAPRRRTPCSRFAAWDPSARRRFFRSAGGGAAPRRPAAGPATTFENAAAAAVVGFELGLDPHAIAASLARFPGRGASLRGGRHHALGHPCGGRLRAQRREAAGGAHHGAGADWPGRRAVPAARLRSGALPAPRAHRPCCRSILRPEDRFCYAEIFYAGGHRDARHLQPAAGRRTCPPRLRCGFAAGHEAARLWVQAPWRARRHGPR